MLGSGLGGDRLLAAVGEAAYYQYERALQREREPELVVSLPAAAAEAGAAEGQQPRGASGAGGQAALRVRVEYEAADPACGLHFFGRFAATANQVRRTSAWLPCVDVPLAAVDFALRLTVRTDEVRRGGGVPPGRSRGEWGWLYVRPSE